MKIAFYAPMKSPDDARPSGDRTIGRLLMAALARSGHDVRLVSRLRTWSGAPDPDRLAGFQADAGREAERLIGGFRATGTAWVPDLWFTYHSYYKAPDLLGPAVSSALAMPYVIVEASYASRRRTGEWGQWLEAARAGIVHADAIFSFTARDRRGLMDVCRPERLHDLAPFLDLDTRDAASPERATGPVIAAGSSVRLISVAMMRPGAKLASYRLLANALALLRERDWHLDIVGDGAERPAVEAAFADLPPARIDWHGRLDAAAVRTLLESGDVFVWPGIDEAFGMAYLEAQAAGLPVAAVRTAGVPEVVRDGETGLLAAAATPDALAACLSELLGDVSLRERLGDGARAAIASRHSLPAASARLDRVLSQLVIAKQAADDLG